MVRLLANVVGLWREDSKQAAVLVDRLMARGLVSIISRCLRWARHREGDAVHFRGDLLRLIANVTCDNPQAQTEFGEQGVLLAILEETRIHEDNPCVREWAIVCLRYLTDKHPRNQQIIADLQMQGVANEAELEDLNLKVQMTAGGKVRVSNLRPPKGGEESKGERKAD